jgi:hypothetical protein
VTPPYEDPVAFLRWVEHHTDGVPPIALERLLSYEGFEEAGTMPTQGPVTCVVWKPRDRREDPRLAEATFLVYHTDVVARERVLRALQLIDRVRRLRRQGVLR